MAAVENSSKESCRPIFFRFQHDFGLRNTSFMKGGDLYKLYYNIFSLIHWTDLKLAGCKLDTCTFFFFGSRSNVVKYQSCDDFNNSINERN